MFTATHSLKEGFGFQSKVPGSRFKIQLSLSTARGAVHAKVVNTYF
jgi:hypothetical protein